jgi:methionyl-tRNA synthetase
MKLLAYCPHCKKIFLSNIFGSIAPETTVKNTRESCPGCGKTAQTGDYISNMMYIAGHEFHTTSDADTLKNILQILQ